MTQATFYILNKKQEHERYIFACKLAEKATHQKLRLILNMPSIEAAEHMDSLLWTFRPDSFVPHELISNDSNSSQPPPVSIYYPQVNPDAPADICINLADKPPPSSIRVNRKIEIALNSPESLSRLRRYYKQLANENVTIEVHDFTKGKTD